MTCVIIDYGSGNLHSALKSFERASKESGLNKSITLTNNPETIAAADHIVLPGVGAYADCLSGLEAIDGLHDALEEAVIKKARPFLGICVGMQLMSTEGHEYKVSKGLNWIPGLVEAIEPNDPNLKIPHMGWNTLSVNESGSGTNSHPILEDINTGDDGLHAYFVHSYHFIPEDPAHILATTNYGGEITAMIAKDNIVGTQFHPEKSQSLGLKLISNFLKWTP